MLRRCDEVWIGTVGVVVVGVACFVVVVFVFDDVAVELEARK